MENAWPFIQGIIILLVAVLGLCWFLHRWLKRSADDAGRLISKWVTSAVMLAITFLITVGTASAGFAAAFIIPFAAVACGIVLTLLWAPNIGGFVARPFTSAYDGGSEEVEPQPYYSIAEANRKRGKYLEAVALVREQLARFPADVTGQMLLAEIQAENLLDLSAAQATLLRFVGQTTHAPKNRAFALNQLADWHLKYGQDPDSAREALQQIENLFPHTELAQLAAQRIAHLATPQRLAEPHARPIFAVPHLEEDAGLKPAAAPTPLEDPLLAATRLARQLEEHPFHYEAREKLAVLYADELQRLDLAVGQLEELIAHPHQPARQVVHWLNLLASLHVRHGGNLAAAGQPLQRIIEQFPQTAAAENAAQRLARLGLELRSRQKSPVLKLGSYEQNLGLKENPWKRFLKATPVGRD